MEKREIIFAEKLKNIFMSLGYERENVVFGMDQYNKQERKFMNERWSVNNNSIHKKNGRGYYATSVTGLFRDSLYIKSEPMVAAIFPEELADMTSAEEKKRIIQIIRYLDLKITDKCLHILKTECGFSEKDIELVRHKSLPIPY